MQPDDLARSANELLAALPDRSLAAIAPHAKRVVLTRGDYLTQPSRQITSAYFVEDGVASVVKIDQRDTRTEICLIGPEGFSATPLLLGADRWPYETFVQGIRLDAVRIDTADLLDCSARDERLRMALLGYVHLQLMQIAEGLASAVWQHLPGRLARWLLMYRDRVRSERLEITHEFIGMMIGAQRSGVTSALHDLESRGLIAAGRGVVVVRDPDGLARLADGWYGVVEGERDRLRQAEEERLLAAG